MKVAQLKEVRLASAKLKKIGTDPVATAKAIKLVYVKDEEEGYTRIKRGKGFQYRFKNTPLKNKTELQRIRSLVIPPAWKDVWICRLSNGHLQATGKDALKRKQYRYHPLWNSLRNQTKFHRLTGFGNALADLRKKIKKDLSLVGLPKEKVLALVISLMDKTSIRIGNDMYEKLYGSFGLSTLKDKHASIRRHNIQFIFKGKKGVAHRISLKNKKLAKIVKQCRDIPGKELFQYYNEDGLRQTIDSGMINEYIKTATGKDFTSKDFRTWTGSLQMLKELKQTGIGTDKTAIRHNIMEAIEKVAGHLGNTPAVCKKYYIHPVLIELYENNQLEKCLKKFTQKYKSSKHPLGEEKLLMSILSKQQ